MCLTCKHLGYIVSMPLLNIAWHIVYSGKKKQKLTYGTNNLHNCKHHCYKPHANMLLAYIPLYYLCVQRRADTFALTIEFALGSCYEVRRAKISFSSKLKLHASISIYLSWQLPLLSLNCNFTKQECYWNPGVNCYELLQHSMHCLTWASPPLYQRKFQKMQWR